MKRGLLLAVGGTAIVIAGLSGCSSDNKSESSSSASSKSESASSSSASETASATAAPTGSGTKLTIDGADQALNDAANCTTVGDTVNVAIGQAGTGVAAIISGGDAPTVTSVGLGNFGGAALAVGPGVGEATATKDGNTYTIQGNATGADMANPTAGMVTKPFELVFTCP